MKTLDKRKGRPADFDYFTEHFKPIDNPTEENYIFETYGEEYEKVLQWGKQKSDNYVWTIIDSNNGLYLVPGWHYIDRFAYILTTIPWKEGQRNLKY